MLVIVIHTSVPRLCDTRGDESLLCPLSLNSMASESSLFRGFIFLCSRFIFVAVFCIGYCKVSKNDYVPPGSSWLGEGMSPRHC